MTRAALARVSAPLALRQADNGVRAIEREGLETPAGGWSSPKVINQPARATATATLAIPLDGLTIMAPQPEMLSQKNVEAVTGVPARVFLDTIRAPGFPLLITKLGKLRLVPREAFVAYLRALASEPTSHRTTEADERTRVAAVLASAGLEPVPCPRTDQASAPPARTSRARLPPK
ncbi:hypothetical protein WME76_46535 (plasmid) [Sorangium sp. So ce119]|uniref:hypothetical protein n=1 Tax=Sorangium sp. So ce119 TaxID=3133279 RepID=UPI003F5EEF78